MEDQQGPSQSGGYLPSSSTASGITPSTPGKRPTSIRPLTAAYQASASQHQVHISTHTHTCMLVRGRHIGLPQY